MEEITMTKTITDILEQITSFLTGIAGGIATISVIIGAINMMSTDPDKIDKGKEMIKVSAIALAIALLANRIVTWVSTLSAVK